MNKKGLVGFAKFSLITASLVILFLFLFNFVSPATSNPSETTVKLSPLADSWVNYPNFANSNYGTTTILNDENANPPEQRQIYVKFNLSSIPPGSIITAATLHMYSMSYSSQVNQSTGVYFVSNDSWTETGLKWNNKPAIGSLIDSTPVYYNAWAVWNVNASVQSEYNGDKIISVNLNFPSTAVNNKKNFYSKEYSNSSFWPYLEIKYTEAAATCSSYNNQSSCESNQSCSWCPSCSGNKYSGGSDRCVDKGTCNQTIYVCEIHPNPFCGATCDASGECSCPADGCVGNDYYDYPVNGVCTDSCSCNIGTDEGQPCAPAITLDDPRCVSPTHSECQSGSCIVVPGAGSNQCLADSDCYHSECNYNLQQCVRVNTSGANSCQSNGDCALCLPDIIVDKKVNPNSFSICQNTTITLNVTGVGCPAVAHAPLDTVLIMDRTGSMDDDCPGGVEANTSPCKIHDAKVAAKFFVDLTNSTTDRNGLVSFSTSATLNQALTFNQTLVKNAIDTLTASGNTGIGTGINAANNHLSSSGRPNVAWIEILLTDGIENQNSDPVGKANNAKALNITIYTIGLGADANASLLQQIANITGGKYYFAANGTMLQQIYQNISKEIMNTSARNVVVKDVIPPYASYAGGLASNPSDNCSYSAGTITCNLGTVSIGQSYVITFNEQFNQAGNELTNVYPDSNVTFTNYNNSQATKVFPQTNASVIACNDGQYCNGVETCVQGACQAGTNVDCSNLNDQCNSGFCNENTDRCEQNPFAAGTPCNDWHYCTVDDVCNGIGNCTGGGSRSCSGYNLIGVATCFNDPDNYNFTWDFRNPFTSLCNENGNNTGYCSSGNDTITHTCSLANCSAECDATHSCQNKCVVNVRYYAGNCSLQSCNCSYTTQNCSIQNGCYAYGNGCEDRTYGCTPDNCTYTSSNNHTDYNDSFVNYCSADTIRKHKQFHDFYCSGLCSDHTSWIDDQPVQDCTLQNGWNDTGQTRWINETQCTEREQKEQKYRNYTCSDTPSVGCTYTNTSTQWVNTTNTRNKVNGTSCEDGLFCTVSDVCTLGVCGGSPRSCSDSNECTQDICNETSDQCQNPNLQDGTNCTGNPGKCCSGACDNNGISGSDYHSDCRTGPSCIGVGNWGFSTANQGLGCDAFIDYCNNASICDSRQRKKSCDLGYCTGSWVNDQDTTGNACQAQDCGTCCICGSNDNRTYDNTQNNDCSPFNIPGIATCFNIPDSYSFTWDYRSAFTSSCSGLDQCSQGNTNITHTCSVDNCSANCDSTHSCDNKCVNNIRYYSGSCDLISTCNCSYTSEDCTSNNGCYAYGNGCEDRTYGCTPDNCTYTPSNQHNDYNDSFVNYCSADTIRTNRTFHDFYCGGQCSDHTSQIDDYQVEDCNSHDGWYNTTNYQWVNDTQCTEKEQVQQEYRDYTCSDASCTYNVTSYQWIDTGNTRNKSSSVSCDDGLYCTVNDHCDGQGICIGGGSRDCSGSNLAEIATCDNNPDDNPFTFDYAPAFTSSCDEQENICTTGSQTLTYTCADANSTDDGPVIPVGNGIRTCTAECDGFGTECQNKCVDNIRYFSGSCNLTSCGCSYSSTEDCTSHNGCYEYSNGCEDRDYSCTPDNCQYSSSNQHTDYNDSSANYCSADTIRLSTTYHDFYCDDTCNDHAIINETLVQNCSLQDGWYNTTDTKWVDMCNCTKREQVKQEYRDYTCVATPDATCNYTVTNTTWVDTGNTTSTPDVSGPMTYSLNAKTVCVKMDCNLFNIKATVKDACSNVAGAEYFFDSCPNVNTRGTPLLASDGTFDAKIEDVYKNSVNVSAMTLGMHTLYARGKDDKGNWGPCTSRICYNMNGTKFCL